MTRVRQVQQTFHDAGYLHRLLQPWGFPTDDVLLMKSGAIAAVYAVEGVDVEGLDQAARVALVRRKEGALRQLDPDVLIYEYLVKRPAPALVPLVAAHPVVTAAHGRRTAVLNAQPSWVLQRYLVVVSTGLTPQRLTPTTLRARVSQLMNPESTITFLEAELDRALGRLHQIAVEVESQLEVLQLTRLEKDGIFQFLRGLLNYGPLPPLRLKHDVRVDQALVEQDVEDHRGRLHVGASQIRVLTLKEPPTASHAGFVQAFEAIPGPFILCLTWRRIDNEVMRQQLAKRRLFFFDRRVNWRTHMAGANRAHLPVLEHTDATALEADHAAAITAMEVHGRFFGDCSLTVVLTGATDKALDRVTAAARTVMTEHDGSLHLEVYNALRAWLAIVPGNDADNIRTLALPETAFADMSPAIFARHTGDPVGADGRPAIAVLETPHEVPFLYQTHIGTTPHTLIIGSTGSGKSVTTNWLTLFGQAVYGRTVIFDVGGSYRNLCTALDGSYLAFDLASSDVTINPFAGEGTPERIDFLQSWMQILLRGTDGYTVTAEARALLVARIRGLMAKPARQRRLASLVYTLPMEMQARLTPWVEGGLYGALFDHVEDTLAPHRFQVFDLEALYLQHHALIEPLFALLFHREQQWQATTTEPTLQVMEEVWLEATDPTLKANLLFSLKGGRKLDVSVILVTQSLEDLDAADIRSYVLESCATKLFVATDDFDRAQYATVFGLNEVELDLIAGLTPRQEFLLKRHGLTRVCRLRMDPETLDICRSQPLTHRRQRRAAAEIAVPA